MEHSRPGPPQHASHGSLTQAAHQGVRSRPEIAMLLPGAVKQQASSSGPCSGGGGPKLARLTAGSSHGDPRGAGANRPHPLHVFEKGNCRGAASPALTTRTLLILLVAIFCGVPVAAAHGAAAGIAAGVAVAAALNTLVE
jgi:hypothetical protein